VKAKQASEERAFAEHVSRGVATVAIKTGADGGMHPVFLAKLQSKSVFEFPEFGCQGTVRPVAGEHQSAAPARARNDRGGRRARAKPGRATLRIRRLSIDWKVVWPWRQRTDGARSTGRREA